MELKLKVFSSFAQEMLTDTIATVPPDPRFSFRMDRKKGAKILSGQKNLIGKIVFDPGAVCEPEENCYAGFDTQSKSEKC